MATPTVAVPDYCTLLSKSKLLPAEEVESLYKKWKDDAQGTDDQVEAFGKYLIGKRALTPWQSAMVQRGRADGFFLDGYKILDQIGKGQMGGVYKAVHSLGQLVALKILPASRARDARILGRFQREARLLTHLDHPNVVRAYQVGDSGGRYYIVMEFLEGETLDEVLARRKKLEIGEIVRLARQALDGLQHLHEKRMVHRDLKPSNLMISPAGGKGAADTTWGASIKILDVGLGRELFDESAPEGLIDTQLTVEGSVVGTPDYMAPEQAKDARSADIRADIYSLGCVLYHGIAGRTPFLDANIMTQMLRHATESPPPLASAIGSVPAGLQQVLDKFMAKKPDDRFQTPAEGAAALRRFETPGSGIDPAKANVTPAYKQWLETETHIIAPSNLPSVPEKVPPIAASGSRPSAAIEPGSSSMTSLEPKPPASAPAKSGTSTHPARPIGGKSSGTAPVQRPSPAPAGFPMPVPVPLPLEDEVEVELVTMPPPAPMVVAAPERVVVKVPDDRPLWDINRRDVFLLAAGGLGVLSAVGFGFGLSKFVRGMKAAPEAEEKKD